MRAELTSVQPQLVLLEFIEQYLMAAQNFHYLCNILDLFNEFSIKYTLHKAFITVSKTLKENDIRKTSCLVFFLSSAGEVKDG